MRLVSWKSGNTIAACALAIVIGQFIAPVSGSARGAQGQDQAKPEQPAPPAAPATPKPAAQQPEIPRRPPVPIPQGPNVRVEITITDQAGSEPPVKKTLNVIAAAGHDGSVRSKVTVAIPIPQGNVPVKAFNYEDVPLNVDVKSYVLDNGLIRTQLMLNYETLNVTTDGGKALRSIVTGGQTVLLENGKPLIVSQSADATSDRKVTVELKATIMR
jgi:hypothetical protein